MDSKNVDSKLAVQHNNLIEAHYRLNLIQTKIVHMLIGQIEKTDEDFHVYRLKIEDMRQALNIDNNRFYKDVKEATKKLMQKVMVIPESTGDLQVAWLSAARYYNGKGYVDLHISSELKPYLLQLKNHFTKYYLGTVLSLKSSYSIRIYQLLKQYEGIGKRNILLEDLRTILGITPNEYKLYGHFKKKVILSTQKEFTKNNQIDLTFKFNEIKNGRKVTAIEFIIISKSSKKEKKRLELSDVLSNVLGERLKKYHVTLNKIIKNMLRENPEHVERCIDFYESEKRQGRDKNNPGGFICDCISGKIEIPEHIQTKEQKEKKKIAKTQKENAEIERDKLYDAFFEQYNNKADNLIQDKQVKADDSQFKQWMKKNHLIEYENHYTNGSYPGMEIIKPFLREYVMEGQPEEICEFEKWEKVKS